jgi:hypothetical protein
MCICITGYACISSTLTSAVARGRAGHLFVSKKSTRHRSNMQRTTLHLFRKSTSTFLQPRRLRPRFLFQRTLSQTPRLKMSSDQEYVNFLEKANQDTGSSSNEVKTSGFAQTKAVDSAVPASLKNVDVFYQSDTDEPFEPVALKYGKKGSISQGQIMSRSKLKQALMSHR